MGFLDNWLDRTVARLGYTKATGRRNLPLEVFFAGEAPLGERRVWSNYSDEQLERLAINCAWVWSDVMAIANEVSQARLQIMEMQGEDLVEVADHEFEALWQQPNPAMGGAYVAHYLAQWFLLRGESYLWLVRDLAGQGLRELWPLPSSRMEPVPDPRTYIREYLYFPRTGEPGVAVPEQQIAFLRRPNPFDYHRGMSALSAYRLALETDTSARTWNRDSFDRGLTLQALVSLPPELDQPAFEQAKEDIRVALEEEKRRFMITRAGDMKVEPVSITHKDAEFLANRSFTRDEIDRVFGFPAGYWSDKANRANAEAAKATMIEQAVWPVLVLFASQLTTQVIKPLYGEQYAARFEDIRPRNRDLDLKEQESKRKVWTFNEARAEAGLDDYAGPYAEEIAELPFPLATDPQFVLSLVKPAPAGPLAPAGPSAPEPMPGGPGEPGEPAEEDEEEDEELTKAAKEDLRRWQSVSLRRLKAGQDLDYEFVSEHIPPELAEYVKKHLTEARTAEEVKAAFAAGFLWPHGLGWESYP